MNRKKNIAFIVELFLMFVIMLMLIVVITRIFVTTRGESLRAKHLTEAVCLAEEVAETSFSEDADTIEGAAELLEMLSNVQEVTRDGDTIKIRMTMAEEELSEETSKDSYDVTLTLADEAGTTGNFVTGQIDVSLAGSDETIYSLDTGHYVPTNER